MLKNTLLIFLFMVLVGCSTTNQNPTEIPDIKSTVTPMPTITRVQLTPTVTPTLAPTTTSTHLPTWTPLPTLTDRDDFLEFISFTGNSICKFPCWAGIIPGKTTWSEAVFALHPIEAVAKLDMLLNQESNYGQVNTISWYLYGDDFRSEGRYLTGSNVSLVRMSFEAFSTTTPSNSLPLPKRFSMQNVLQEYGTPSMVLIYTFIHDQPDPIPFQVVLVYSEYQFYVEYHRDAELRGNNIIACNSDFYMKLAVLDTSDKLSSFDSIANALETKELGVLNMKPVEQVLKITPEAFHEIYSKSNSECIILPTMNWSS